MLSKIYKNVFKVVNKIKFSKPKALLPDYVAGLEPVASPKGTIAKV